ncbi:phage terminase small subunit [Tissierella carlieri]|uniref:Phage terminase small subunit n=1 Tax=Tissierella carlieri TaxID=689904 RepID=A0ABT1S5D8_9FIRM|nr:phage terminase small subunit [Tissierella carlieri]
MSDKRNPDRIKAEKIYLEHNGNIELIKIAEMLGRPPGTIRGWKNKDKWDDKLNGTFRKNQNETVERSSKKKGGQPNNKNAVGNDGGAPIGNLNAIKHGAYQSLYYDMLNTEDKILFNTIDSTVNVDDEIKLLRLKIAKLLNLGESFFYNMFGMKVDKEVSEEERIKGINECMDQLRKLIETKAKTETDTEKLQLEKEKFEFQKYKSDVELQLKKEKLELEKLKVNGEDEDHEDDGFIDALKGQASEVWEDEDTEED